MSKRSCSFTIFASNNAGKSASIWETNFSTGMATSCGSTFFTGVGLGYMVFFKRLVAKYRVTTLLRLIYCFSAVVMLPFGLPSLLRTDFSTMSPHILLAALFVLCVPTYLPNLLLNFSLRYVAPTISSTYAYIQPVLAIALSVAMGLDRLHADTLVAAAVIFVGVGLVISSYGRPSSQPPHSSSQPLQQQ